MFRKGDNPKARLTVSGVWSLESSGEVIIFGRYTPMLLHSNLLLVDSYISCATRMAMHSHAFTLKTPRKNDHYDAPLKLYSVSNINDNASGKHPFWSFGTSQVESTESLCWFSALNSYGFIAIR